MAAVTWKNITPVNSAGVLNSINTAGQQIGKGFAGVGDAITDYADNRSTRETDQLVAAMTLIQDDGTDAGIKRAKADRSAILQSINPDTSFADLSTVVDAWKTANTSVDPSWEEQEKIKHNNAIALQYVKNNDSSSKSDEKYNMGSIASTLTKRDGDEAALSGWMNLGGDTPTEEVTDKLTEYFSNPNTSYGKLSAKEQQRAIKIILGKATLDTAGINEYYLGNMQFEDATSSQLDAILLQGGFLTDAQKKAQSKTK